MHQHYDIIIIGTGAGGGTLAYALATTGKRILLLDRGDYIPREKMNWDPDGVYLDQRYRTEQRWLNSDNDTFRPSLYHRVGGSTKVYGAALLRMRERDFDAIDYPDGRSPAWDLSYDDFEPYYQQAERLYKVHGRQGEDPFEPQRSQDYPFPPLPHEPRIQQVAEQLQQVGLRPFSLPMGIDYNSVNRQQSPCIWCDTCDGYPCLVNAKADAQVCCVDPALRHENVTLKTGVQCDRLVTDASGRVIRAIEVTVDGRCETVTADIVVVACGAINSAALLLRSATSQWPDGLANSSGLVGRNLMRHNATKLYAISTTALNPTVFQKTLAVNDFYFGSPETPYPMGHVHLMGKHHWQMMRPDFPQWVPTWTLKLLASRSVDWWAQSEDLPVPTNYVSLASSGQIKVNYRSNNVEVHRQLVRQFKAVLLKAGFMTTFEKPMPLKIMNHQVGTCRFGADPKTSVLDLNCRTHDIDNLYVVDSSFFPSISSVNPTLTIVANALRVADHLKQRFNIYSPDHSLIGDRTSI